MRLIAFALLGLICVVSAPAHAAGKPNVVFIAIDDMNDWIGHMGGHPQAKTPHIDALAARGTTFLNAHCQAPLCNPSRTSLMLSLRPSTTGIYGLSPWFRTLPEFKDRVSLPQHFAAGGYHTMTVGKIYHGGAGGGGGGKKKGGKAGEPVKKEWDEIGNFGGIGVKPAKKLIPPTPEGDHPLMDWGVFDHKDEDKGDYQVASWAVEKIREHKGGEKPYFLAVGFFLPHVPMYATQKWFDLHPLEQVQLPPVLESDRDDVPDFAWYMHWKLPEPRLSWLKRTNQWKPMVQAYLASTSFMDSQVGRVLTALKETGQEDNTIVVLWGDHGWHLGEKGISGKNSLWERSARVPLVFAGPGVTKGQRCMKPAELMDMYPTLVELAGLPARSDLEGHSLVPQLRDANAAREWPAITTHNQHNHGIRSERYRYIHYHDGSEELYDLQADANEWKNLAKDPKYASVLAEHRRWLPKVDVPPAPGSASRVLTYEGDKIIWEGKPTNPADLEK